jgi:hypothetical protein
MNYTGKEVRLGDVVEHEDALGEWTVDVVLRDYVELVGVAGNRMSSGPTRLRLLRRAAKPARAPRAKRGRPREHRERSVALNVGAHLGVAAVHDDDDGEIV